MEDKLETATRAFREALEEVARAGDWTRIQRARADLDAIFILGPWRQRGTVFFRERWNGGRGGAKYDPGSSATRSGKMIPFLRSKPEKQRCDPRRSEARQLISDFGSKLLDVSRVTSYSVVTKRE